MELTYKTNQYATHQPLLIEVIKNTSGNILELGCGDGSTHLIRDRIDNTRTLYSLESNMDWLNKYRHLESDNHKLMYVDAANDDTDEIGEKWVSFIKNNIGDIQFEIVFIDQSPWTARLHAYNYFKDKAKYIIIHDVDYFAIHTGTLGKIVSEVTEDGKIRAEIDYSDYVKHSYLFTPPFEYYTYHRGIPTLLCSDIANGDEFNNMVDIIKNKYASYY
jgi:hypothetical protein